MSKCACEMYRELAVDCALGQGEIGVDFHFNEIYYRDYRDEKIDGHMNIKYCPFCGKLLGAAQLKIEGLN